jgi:sarcosine oxidase subunit gamma
VDEKLVTERCNDVGLGTIMARKGVGAQQIGQALGMTLGEGGGVARNGPLSLVGTGPGTWLAVSEAGDEGLVKALQSRLSNLASISDQSSGYAVFRLSGRKAREVLQRGVPIDLDPLVFGMNSAATTVIAHMGVILWQGDDGSPSYYVALFRSFADSFSEWLHSVTEAL